MARCARIDPTVWKEAQIAAEDGLMLRTVAERFGIPLNTVKSKSLRDKWQTPTRTKFQKDQESREARGAAPSQSIQSLYNLPEEGCANGTDSDQEDPNPVKPILSKLQKLRKAAGSDPKVFQALMAEIAEDKLAIAMAEADPRSISEIKQLNDLVRRNHGMDQAGAKPQGFVRPLRSLSRLAIDAEPVDPDYLDGFEI